METRWIVCVMIDNEDCRRYAFTKVKKGETIEDAKRRSLKPEWEGIGAALANYTPTEEDIAEVLDRWDVFVFSNADYVEKLKAVSPPGYTGELQFAITETLSCVYKVFADEVILGGGF